MYPPGKAREAYIPLLYPPRKAKEAYTTVIHPGRLRRHIPGCTTGVPTRVYHGCTYQGVLQSVYQGVYLREEERPLRRVSRSLL